jgi:hypothetical protein
MGRVMWRLPSVSSCSTRRLPLQMTMGSWLCCQILADIEGAALDTAGVQLGENLDDFHLRVVLLFF